MSCRQLEMRVRQRNFTTPDVIPLLFFQKNYINFKNETHFLKYIKYKVFTYNVTKFTSTFRLYLHAKLELVFDAYELREF